MTLITVPSVLALTQGDLIRSGYFACMNRRALNLRLFLLSDWLDASLEESDGWEGGRDVQELLLLADSSFSGMSILIFEVLLSSFFSKCSPSHHFHISSWCNSSTITRQIAIVSVFCWEDDDNVEDVLPSVSV